MPNQQSFMEGRFQHQVDDQTAQIPSVNYLYFAIGSMALSAGLILFKKKELGNFVGLWAPSILVMGVYNKLIKVQREVEEGKSVDRSHSSTLRQSQGIERRRAS